MANTYTQIYIHVVLVDALRGIQRGLDEMKAGKGEPARKVLDRIRAKHKIPFPKL
jgi:hypothetical protein